MTYLVEFLRSAEKEHSKITQPFFHDILDSIIRLGDNPKPFGCKKLKGHSRLWRIKVGKYRVVYELDEVKKTVAIIRIRHRKDVYMNL